jgi:iron complex transport system substrate-binding protein
MFKSFPRLFILLALLLCGAARAEDQTSKEVRIVVCAPNLAEYVYGAGLFYRVVGVSRFTEFPPEAASRPAVTDFANPDLEAIAALKPTVIIALQSNTAVVEYFSKQPGIEVIQIGKCETFEDAFAATKKIKDAIDPLVRAMKDAAPNVVTRTRPDPANLSPQEIRNLAENDKKIRAIIRERQSYQRLQHEYETAKANPPGPNAPTVLMILGGDELRPGGVTAIGQGTHISQLLEIAGARNVLPEDLGVYPMLNKEAILRYDPDMILFLSETPQETISAAKVRASWASVLPTLKAVKREDGFRYINDSRLKIPGPRAMGALPAMREALRVEAPKVESAVEKPVERAVEKREADSANGP